MKTSALVYETLQLCLSRAVVFLIGAILFGSITAASSLWMETYMNDFTQDVLAPIQQSGNGLGVLLDTMENGTSDDVMNVLIELQSNSEISLDALSLLGNMIPVVKIVLWSAMISFLISCISSLYFLCCAALQTPSVFVVFRNFLLSIPAMILILLWSFVRSYTWIPIVGPLIGLILFPRFLFAPILYLQGQKNVLVTVRESYNQTKGYTWYILSAFSVISFIAMLVAVIAIVVLSMVLDTKIGQYSVFLRSIIWQMSLGYTIASLVVMWRSDVDANISF